MNALLWVLGVHHSGIPFVMYKALLTPQILICSFVRLPGKKIIMCYKVKGAIHCYDKHDYSTAHDLQLHPFLPAHIKRH